MSYEKLVSLGAEAVGGIVYLNRVKVGSFESDGFQLTEDGRKALVEVVGTTTGTADGQAIQVDVVETARVRAPRKVGATPVVEQVEPQAPTPAPAQDLGSALDGQ